MYTLEKSLPSPANGTMQQEQEKYNAVLREFIIDKGPFSVHIQRSISSQRVSKTLESGFIKTYS